MCVTVSGYTLKWASTSETRSKWYAMKGATVAKTMQYRFQITNMTELRERESTGGSSYSGKEGLKRYPSFPSYSLPSLSSSVLLPNPPPTRIMSFSSHHSIPPSLPPSSSFSAFFCLILPCPALPYLYSLPYLLTLSYLLILPYRTLPYLTLLYRTLPCLTLSYRTLPYNLCVVCYRVVTREFAAESVGDMEEWVSRVQACIDRCDGTDKDKEGTQKKSLTFVNTPLRTEVIDRSKPDVHITSDSNTETVCYNTPLNLALNLVCVLALILAAALTTAFIIQLIYCFASPLVPLPFSCLCVLCFMLFTSIFSPTHHLP